MLTPSEKDNLKKELESKGEKQAREDFEMGHYSELRKKYVAYWLAEQKKSEEKKRHQNNSITNWVGVVVAILAVLVAIGSAFYKK